MKFRVQFINMVITFRALHSQIPSFISELLQPNIMSRSLVSPDQCLLAVPRSRLKTKGDCVFVVMAPELWNSLSLKLRSLDTVDISKKKLKITCARLLLFSIIF